MLRQSVRMRRRSYAVPPNWVRSPTAAMSSPLSLIRRAKRLAQQAVAARLQLIHSGQRQRLRNGGGVLGFFERLPQIPEKIIDVLDAYRYANHVGTDSTSGKLLIRQLLVRGRSGMNDEALAIADICEM